MLKVGAFTKKIALKAVRIGGGHIHRLNLSDSILIFDNHIKFLGGIDALAKKIPEIRKRAPGKRITVEVKTAEDALLMGKSSVDCLQIDKLPANELLKLVPDLKKINPQLFISASGNINEENIGSFAETGIDMIITSYPYYGKPADLYVNIEPVFDL